MVPADGHEMLDATKYLKDKDITHVFANATDIDCRSLEYTESWSDQKRLTIQKHGYLSTTMALSTMTFARPRTWKGVPRCSLMFMLSG